jgi:ABC-type uncharacterized transport system auxiliary subunit
MHRVVVPIIVAALLAGCTMPKTRIYSLTLPPEQEVQRASGHAFLALRVDSPRYLAQPYIASRKSPYEIEISRYSKWDSPPREILMDALKGSLASTGLFREIRTSNAVPADFYSLKIDLKRFEAVDEGSASFGEVTFQIAFTSPQGTELRNGRISKRAKLGGTDSSSLARGFSTALGEGLKEVTSLVAAAVNER